MSYAQKILEKYGWKDGDGLGKSNNGIKQPLKASLKFDNAGFGVDKADEFNNHWWERVFNEAANNVKVDKVDGKVSVKIKNEESVEITTKEYSVRKLKQKNHDSYDNFLLSSTLTNTGNEVSKPDKIEVDDIKVAPHRVLTDEELFMACGGRTAHKGARHGLNLSGKLARLEKQEKEMLMKMQGITAESNASEWTVVKNKKKKKDKEKEKENPDEEQETVPDENESKIDDILYTAEYCIKSKKKRKEKKKTEEELSGSLGVISLETKPESEALLGISDQSKTIKKSKKSKKGKKKSEAADWDTYRDSNEGDGVKDELVVDDVDQTTDETNCEQGESETKESTKKKKSKKCKHGIDKEAKEAYKESKKLKRKLKKIAEDFEQSCVAVA